MTEKLNHLISNDFKYEHVMCSCCLGCANSTVDMDDNCTHEGVEESYFEILNRCFDTRILDSLHHAGKYYICDFCIQRLVDSYMFKCQVIKSLETISGIANAPGCPSNDSSIISVISATFDTEKRSYDSDFHHVDEENLIAHLQSKTYQEPLQINYESGFQKKKSKNRKLKEIIKKEPRRKESKKRKATIYAEIQKAMDLKKKQCRICMKTFSSNVVLNIHLNEHFPNYTCEVCGKSFATIKRCKGHASQHKREQAECPICKMVFANVVTMNNHKAKHRTSKYMCRHCDQRFKSFYTRQKHLRVAHNDWPDAYACKTCEFVGVTRDALLRHVKNNHTERSRMFQCTECGKVFLSIESLRCHRKLHKGIKKYKCSECDKNFMWSNNLVQHMKIHNDIRDFCCSHCGQAFVQKCSLKAHLLKHTKDTN